MDDGNVGVVAGVLGRTERGAEIDLELLLLPLAFDDRTRVRALGALAPVATPVWLGIRPVTALDLGTFRHLDIGGGKCFWAAPAGPRLLRGCRVFIRGVGS